MSNAAPWAEFEGKSWDENGGPVDRHKSPGLITDLPVIEKLKGEKIPDWVTLRLLGGNYYGEGPMIFLWDEANELSVSLPLWARKNPSTLAWKIASLVEARKMKMAGKRDNGIGYQIKGSKIASTVRRYMTSK